MAKAQVDALHVRGRGCKRYEDIETLRQAVHEMVQRYGVAEFLWLRYDHHHTTRQRRAYRGRPAQRRETSSKVIADPPLGWRLFPLSGE